MTRASKKILVIGNAWHGNFTMFIHSAISELGYECEHVNLNEFDRKPFIFRKLYLQSRKSANVALNRFLTGKIESEDIGLVVVLANFNMLPATMDVIKRKKIRTLGWHGDDPFRKGGAMLQNIRFCDKVFLVDEEWVGLSRYLNPNVQYLPSAADHSIFRPLDTAAKYENGPDILFVGDCYGGLPDGVVRAEMLKALHDSGFRVRLYGPDSWARLFTAYPFLERVFVDKTVRPEELNRLYNTSKIVLNVHHSQLKSGTNQRTFEIAASGAFQLSDYRRSIGELFGGSVITFSSRDDLVTKARHYLADDNERQRLATDARNVVLGGHTYAHRARKLLEE